MNSIPIYRHNLDTHYPASLTCHDHFSVCKLIWSPEKEKYDKIPLDAKTGLPANCEDVSLPFDEAVKYLGDNRVIRYFHPARFKRRLALIDSDRCILPDGSINSRIVDLIRYLNTYAEYSVSDGIHLLAWIDEQPPDGHKDSGLNVEFYWGPRSIPLTGRRVALPNWESPDDVQVRTAKYLRLHKERFPRVWTPPEPVLFTPSALSADQILQKLFAEPDCRKWLDVYQGRWQEYYPTASEADLGLLMKFAFYSGCNRAVMDELFSGSPLGQTLCRGNGDPRQRLRKTLRRPKWQDPKYRNQTLDAAIDYTTSVYTPQKRMTPAEEVRAYWRNRNAQTK